MRPRQFLYYVPKQAIGNKIKANNPNAKIIYVSSENFMNEFITSIRETQEFSVHSEVGHLSKQFVSLN